MCRKDGIERKYLITKGEEIPEDVLIYEKETNERNGVIVTIVLNNNYNEYNNCIKAIKQQLSYLDNIYYNIVDFDNDFKIFKHELFEWNSLHTSNELHISLKGIYYPINWDKLGINRIDIPLALRFDNYDFLQPVFNREELIWSSVAKENILERIEEVAEFFVGKYNETTHFQSFGEALYRINEIELFVTLADKEFRINSLISHSTTKVNSITVEGLEKLDLVKMKYSLDHFSDLYREVAFDDRGTWRNKHVNTRQTTIENHCFKSDKTTILVDKLPVGRVKTYLRNKYNQPYILYIERKRFPDTYNEKGELVTVGSNKERELKTKGMFDNCYYSILQLSKHLKNEWREIIKQFQIIENELCSRFINELNIENNPEFIQWLEQESEYRKKARAEKRERGEYISKSINKEKGQITVRKAKIISRQPYTGYDVYTKDILSLHKTSGLCIYYTKGNAPENLYELIKAFPNISFLQLNQTEIKYVLNYSQFMPLEKLPESKPWLRLITAIKAEEILDLTPDNTTILKNVNPKFQKLHDALHEYTYKNLKTVNEDLRKILMEKANEDNTWDENIYSDILEYKELMSKFAFLKYLNLDDFDEDNEEEMRVMKNLVYVMLKNRKVTGKGIDDMQLVPRDSLCLDTIPAEEMELQETI